MRAVLIALVLSLCVLPGWTGDQTAFDEVAGARDFDLGLSSLADERLSGGGLGLDLDSIWLQDRRPFDASSALDVESAREFRIALWSSPLARTGYAMAAEQAMLGREGLVNGGHMLGLGLSTTVLGDASHGGGINLLTDGRATWLELSAGEKLQVGLEVTIAAGILYAIFAGLD